MICFGVYTVFSNVFERFAAGANQRRRLHADATRGWSYSHWHRGHIAGILPLHLRAGKNVEIVERPRKNEEKQGKPRKPQATFRKERNTQQKLIFHKGKLLCPDNNLEISRFVPEMSGNVYKCSGNVWNLPEKI